MTTVYILMTRTHPGEKATPVGEGFFDKAKAEESERDWTEHRLYEDTTYFIKEILVD